MPAVRGLVKEKRIGGIDRALGEAETKSAGRRFQLEVLDARLAGRRWIMGDDYTIADIATFPWVRNLIGFYGAGELVGLPAYANVGRALDAFLARPAVIRGLEIPKGR